MLWEVRLSDAVSTPETQSSEVPFLGPPTPVKRQGEARVLVIYPQKMKVRMLGVFDFTERSKDWVKCPVVIGGKVYVFYFPFGDSGEKFQKGVAFDI